jgi:hypothetical protein
LKEEKDAHSIQLVHLSGLCLDAQLVASIRHKADSAAQTEDSIVYFWRKASKNGAVTANLEDAIKEKRY